MAVPKTHENIGIYGMGIEGKSLYTWLKKHGYSNISCFDEHNSMYQKPSEKLRQCNIIFRSPGVHPQKIIDWAIPKEKISSGTQLFFELSPTKNIIGVTGTKGKGTTSTLIKELLKAHFYNSKTRAARVKIFLGGNIGTPIFDFFDQIHSEDIVILEMSSFQLYNLTISPHIAVLLRTDTEHLDWHSNVTDYRNAKKNIFLHQKKDDIFIYFGKTTLAKEIAQNAPSKNAIELFGNDITVQNEKIVFTQQENKDPINVSDIALRGSFHQENVLAAIATAKQFGVENETIRTVLQSFTGLPMRCELRGKKDDRLFYNDSFSTIPETTIASLSTFSSPIYLILGGSEKKSDFTLLAEYIAHHPHIQKIYLIGETSNRILETLKSQNVSEQHIQKSASLHDIFHDFSKHSQKGDSLLLSPGCASFGMFKNYKERGNIFNKLAEQFITIK